MRKETVSTGAIRRSTIVALAVFGVFAVLLIRILIIQTVNFEKYQSKVINQMTTESPVPADRGKIFDRNGNVLATNITTYRVFISPSSIASASGNEGEEGYVNYAAMVSKGLSETLGVTYDSVYKQATGYTQYLDRTIQRKVKEETADKVREFIEANDLEDMIYLEAQSTRYYPGDTLGAHVIGFTNSDGVGLYGLEYQYDQYLRGTDGYYILARDSYGKEMPYEYASYIDAVDGYDVTTTIDASVQSYLEEQLEKTVKDHKVQNRACGIVMDVNTGAILAMATSSPFDLNDPWAMSEEMKATLAKSGYSEGSDEYNALLSKTLTESWSNKAVAESYIPGSTFKIITSSMALEEKLVSLNETVNCGGSKKVLGINIHCHKVQGHGSLTFAGGLQQSCNVWFMTLGGRIGVDKFVQYTDIFGYREKTGIDLPGESSSIFIEQMSELDLAIYAFGQNFNVTPIQQISAVSSVANGGKLTTPYLVQSISDASGNVVYSHEVEVKRETVSEDVCKTISQMLEEGVSGNGGAKNAYVAGYKVAAKTGTSEKKKSTYDFAEAFASAVNIYKEKGGDVLSLYNTLDPDGKLAKEPDIYSDYVDVPLRFGQTYYKKIADDIRSGGSVLKRYFTQNQINGMIALAEEYESDKELYICSTVAYAPADNPQVAIIIIVDEPTKGTLYGSTVAAPYVAEALKNILPQMGITAQYTDAELKKLSIRVGSYSGWTVGRAKERIEELGLSYKIVGEDNDSLKVSGQLPASGAYVEKSNGVIYLYTDKSLMVTDIEVPNLIGMDAMTANAQLTARGLNIRIEGSKYHLTGTGATVYEQSIPAGMKVAKGQVITVKCRTEDEDYISNPID